MTKTWIKNTRFILRNCLYHKFCLMLSLLILLRMVSIGWGDLKQREKRSLSILFKEAAISWTSTSYKDERQYNADISFGDPHTYNALLVLRSGWHVIKGLLRVNFNLSTEYKSVHILQVSESFGVFLIIYQSC